MKTTLILPAYNEEEALPKTLEEYFDYADEIIIVNDGSKDNTDRLASEYASKFEKVKYIKHEVNRGKPEALRTGVKNSTGDILIFTDTDCTYPARYIPEAIKEIENGADMVLGARIFNDQNVPKLNRLGNRIFSMLITYFCYSMILDAQTGFRVMRKSIFPRLDVNARNLEYETKMTMRAAKLGYDVVEIPIEYRQRVGRSKLNPFKDGYNMLKSIPSIIWKESTLLLKSVLVVNAVLFSIGLLFGAFSLYQKLTIGVVTHEYYPLIAVIFILVAMQLMSFSLIMDFIVNKLNMIEKKIRK
ncbi:glycosyltransferase family 2 protein [Methanocella sp. CWC-04]|uniref:Glycosyltransferase family 2 protein n=1 Tax=Methanooceanicella nereidis TaxID=2052831 RepID=A0AAP2RDR4_9EURY|nr:glycosyltransferase family 2 protein [Methanocella sp. CWC-04]MCD1294175.1 glycosyltransferase family 2 protein [Methanocella sp. CWC-04]